MRSSSAWPASSLLTAWRQTSSAAWGWPIRSMVVTCKHLGGRLQVACPDGSVLTMVAGPWAIAANGDGLGPPTARQAPHIIGSALGATSADSAATRPAHLDGRSDGGHDLGWCCQSAASNWLRAAGERGGCSRRRRAHGRLGAGAHRRLGAGAHSGMFPCLRRGSSSFLDARRSSERTMTRRVSAGSMTSSTYPRSAATYGLA